MPAGLAPVLGARLALKPPLASSVTSSEPGVTAWPAAVVNDCHEISTVPCAGEPSARYIVSLI